MWIYGLHTVAAALSNPKRRLFRLLITPARQDPIAEILIELPQDRRPSIEVVEPARLQQLLPGDAAHQGVVLETAPLTGPALAELLAHIDQRACLVLLDQVTDPQNVGAILRSAAAFGADGVIVPGRHAAPQTAVLAKAASGALDVVPLVSVSNLAHAIGQLKDDGFWVIGLDGAAPETLESAAQADRTAFVLGAEGAGLRRLTRDRCDLLARLPTGPGMVHLNVAQAAAIALYAWRAAAAG